VSEILGRIRAHIGDLSAYPPGKPISELERELGVSGVIKLGSNESPLGPSPRAIQAVAESIGELHRYPDGSCFHLRAAVSKQLGVAPENLLFGAGSDEILEILAKVFLNPGDEVAYFWPSFAMYPIVAAGMGGKVRPVELRSPFALDPESLCDAIGPNTKLVFIANPNNPTGTSLGQAELEVLLQRVPQDVVLVLDEAYIEYMRRDDRPRTLEAVSMYPNLVVMRTFSKIYGLAALRVGYAVADAELIHCLERARHPFNVNSLAQAAAEAAIEDQEHVQAARELTLQGLKQLETGFDALGLRYIPSDANFVLVDVEEDGPALDRRLQGRGVIARSLAAFGLRHYLRVTAGLPEENARFLEALRQELGGS